MKKTFFLWLLALTTALGQSIPEEYWPIYRGRSGEKVLLLQPADTLAPIVAKIFTEPGGRELDPSKRPYVSRTGYFASIYYAQSTQLPQTGWIEVSIAGQTRQAYRLEVGYKTVVQAPINYTFQITGTSGGSSGPVQWSAIQNKPTLFSGNYTDLVGKPALFSGSFTDLTNRPLTFAPSTHTHPPIDVLTDATHRFVTDAQILGWNSSTGSGFSGNYADLIGKPTLFSGNYADLTNKPTIPAAFSGSYLDLTNKPTLFSGNYTDLLGKPTLFSGSYLDLSNRPSLSTVATSGSYTDLLNRPSLFSGSYVDLTNKPILFSGDYNDLLNKPTIPPAFSGSYTDLLNKPTLFSGSYVDLTSKPVLFSGSYTDLTNKPTIPTVPTNVSSFTNDALYRSTNQVAAQIKDSLTSNAVTFSGDFVKSGNTIAMAQPFSGTAVDQSIIANSTNPVSGGAVQLALAGKAAASHTQTASTISDFNTAVASYLQSLSGFGAGTVLSSNLTWVSATSGSALPQLATPVLSAGTSTSSTIPLTWAAVANATSYTLSQAIDPQFSNGLFDTYTGAALTFTPSGLASGTTYYYRLTAGASGFANSNYGFNTATTSGAATPTLATPTVTVGVATTATLTASWSAVTNATSYSVSYATNSGFTTGLVSSTQTATSLTASGLSPNTTYYFRVAAVAAGYNSSAYGTANGTTSATTSTTALGSPTLTLSGVTSSGATATWTSVTNASGYALDRATNSGFSAGLSTVYSGTALTFTDAGLSASTAYFYRVKATGGGNYTDSPYSTTQTITTSAAGGSTTALAQVTNLNSNGVSTTAITTAWVSVTNATSYQVELSTNNFTSVLTTINSGTALYATFTGLTPGTLYYVRVKAVGSGSYTDGTYSSIINRTTTASQAGTYAVSRTWKVNFSTSSNTTAVTNWVTLGVANASITTGYSSASLTTSDGTASTLSVSIAAGFSGGSVAVFAATAPTQGGMWPDLVLNRGWSFPNATSTIAINGLDPSKNYNLFLPAAAPSSGTQGYLSVTATGSSSQTSGIKYMPGNVGVGSASDTDSPALLNVYNITPTAAGTITYTMGRFSGSNSSWQTQGFILQESNIVK